MSDTLTDDVLPGQKPADGSAAAGESDPKAPVSRAEYDKQQQQILDLQATLNRGLAANRQSANDTIKNEVQHAAKTTQDFLVTRLAAFLPQGQTLEAIEREAWVDAQRAAGQPAPAGDKSGSPDSAPSPASGGSLMKQEVEAILKETGLNGDEPELLEYVRANKGQPWFKVGNGFYELALKIAARNRGSAGGIVAGAGARLPDSSLKDAFLADVAKLRKEGRFGLYRLSSLKDDYRKRGLTDVDRIPLTGVS